MPEYGDQMGEFKLVGPECDGEHTDELADGARALRAVPGPDRTELGIKRRPQAGDVSTGWPRPPDLAAATHGSGIPPTN